MSTRSINALPLPALAACSTEVRDSLDAAMAGEELTFEQGLQLATAQGQDLDALVAGA
jgi:hypothetical protein